MLNDRDFVEVNLMYLDTNFLLRSTRIDKILTPYWSMVLGSSNISVYLLLQPFVCGTHELKRRSVSDLT
jgi:hypothetical protein